MKNIKSQQITILGSTMSYWVFNPTQSPTIVMVHGFRGTHHGLQAIIGALPDFRIIIPDLPGFGDSTPMTDRAHDINGYSDCIEQFMKQLKLPSSTVLLGHSFGSIIAANVAARSPKILAKLILINPIATPALKGPRKLFTQFAIAYYWLGRKLPQNAGERLLRSRAITKSTSALLAKTKDKTKRQQIHQAHLEHFSRFQTRDTLNQAFMASIRATATDYASNIKAPTLLIVGDIDDVAPLTGQHRLAKQLQHATLIQITEVGHLIHHEAPEQAAAAITEFIL